MIRSWKFMILLLLIGSMAAAQEQPQSYRTLDDLKQIDGFQKLLPKGKIPAIFQPKYVPASETTIPDDAWIIGVTWQNHARAYSINLLNHHEIVNDFIGEKPIATTW